jgi:hypothetical protein
MVKGETKMLSLAQAAERSGYEVSALRRLAINDKFPAQKIGNQWVVSEAKLEKWMSSADFRKKQGRPKKSAGNSEPNA